MTEHPKRFYKTRDKADGPKVELVRVLPNTEIELPVGQNAKQRKASVEKWLERYHNRKID